MKVGYARVSTDEQRVDLQTQALTQAGCDKILCDQGISGNNWDRPGLSSALETLQPGDTLVVWRLDRLGRSLAALVQLVDDLGRRGIDFVSLTEAIDTSSPGGRLVFHMMAALSEFERMLISERTRAGMQAAIKKGRRMGRPPLLSENDLVSVREAFYLRGESITDIASRFKVSARTLRNHMKRHEA